MQLYKKPRLLYAGAMPLVISVAPQQGAGAAERAAVLLGVNAFFSASKLLCCAQAPAGTTGMVVRFLLQWCSPFPTPAPDSMEPERESCIRAALGCSGSILLVERKPHTATHQAGNELQRGFVCE